MSRKGTSHSEFVTHANGQVTHYIVDDFTDPWKPKETILIQPGFARNFAFWYHWIPTLARHYRVVRRDLRGHGFSSVPGPDYDYSLDTVLGEIVDLIDHLGVDKVHMLGESTGGLIAVAFAAKCRDRCHSLVNCATPSHLPEAAKEEFAQGYKSWEDACRELGAAGYMQGRAKMPGSVGQSGNAEYSKWWLEQIDLSSGEGLARYASFLRTLDVRPLHKDIKSSDLPVMLLAPTRSRNTSLEDQMSHKDTMGAKVVVIDGSGHEIYVDKAEECQKALLDFLGSLKR